MNDKQRFKLIDGTFTPSEASRVLLALVKSKMDYHSMEKFSNEVRYGGDVARSEKRLQELAQLNASLQEFFGSTSTENQTLKVDGWIEITPV